MSVSTHMKAAAIDRLSEPGVIQMIITDLESRNVRKPMQTMQKWVGNSQIALEKILKILCTQEAKWKRPRGRHLGKSYNYTMVDKEWHWDYAAPRHASIGKVQHINICTARIFCRKDSEFPEMLVVQEICRRRNYYSCLVA